MPLQSEVKYLENVIELQRISTKGAACINFTIEGYIGGQKIATLLLIAFVENAFKHEVAIGRSSEIDISIVVADKKLNFTCENTIYSVKKMDDEKSGIGLENVKRRLALLYPGKYELFIKTDDNKYIVNLGITIE